MSGTSTHTHSAPRTLWLRPVACGALLLCEYLFISQRFDALALAQVAGEFSSLGNIGALGPTLLAAAAALALFADRDTPRQLRELLEDRPYRPVGPLVVGHALGYALLVYTSAQVFGAAAEGHAPSGAWVATWLVAALWTGLSLLLLALPQGAPWELWRRYWKALLAAAGVGVLAWLAGWATGLLWRPLTGVALTTVSGLLQGAGFAVELGPGPRDIGLGHFLVNIAPECSGLEGMGLISVLLLGYSIRFRHELRWPHALLLLPLGVATIWITNIFRITALLLVGAYVSVSVAVGGFHGKIGWALFCAVSLTLIAVARRSRFFSKLEPSPAPDERELHNPTAPLLVPLIVLLAVGLIAGLFVADFDTLYPLRVVAVGAALFAYRKHYGALRPPYSPLAWLAGLAVAGIWLLTAPADPEASARTASALARLPDAYRPVWLAFRFLGAVITVPMAEELAFRGFLQRRLVDPDFERVDPTRFHLSAWLITSVAFGLLHPAWIAGTLAGLVYGLLMFRTGKLGDAVIAHGVTNLVLGLYVLATGQWSAW